MSRLPFLHRLLVACYPRRWRERYADELRQVLADRGSGWRDLPNLAGGVADAWLNRGLWPAATPSRLAAAMPSPAARPRPFRPSRPPCRPRRRSASSPPRRPPGR